MLNPETDKIIQFTLIYNRCKKNLYNFLLRLSGDKMAAEDIVQTVFLKFYENFDSLKNLESANFWIFKSARNEFYNYTKRSKNKSSLKENLIENHKDEFELERFVELRELKNIILNELNKMDDDQKEVYLLKEYGGLTYKEISEAMSIDIDLVKSRLYKVRQKLIYKISKIIEHG